MKSKHDIRANILKKRQEIAYKEKEEKSKKIISRLKETAEYKHAKTILSYISLGSEVDTKEFLKEELEGKRKILVPYTKAEDMHAAVLKSFESLVEGRFKVLEPKEKKDYKGCIDLVIVPGIAFDSKGDRVGYGKGCFDRFLAKHPKSFKIALSFDMQVVKYIRSEKHDIPVNMIITETKIIRCMKEAT